MDLAEQILRNQQAGLLKKNEQLIKIRLKELVYDYTDEVIEVLHKTGIAVSAVLPDDVILTIVIKHLAKNDEFRMVISKMLLELDGHYSADGEKDGKGLAIIGGALSAVGSVLAGIGQGQFNNTGQQQQQMFMVQQQQQRQIEQDRKRRTTFIIIGVSIVLLIAAVLVFRTPPKNNPAVQTSTG